MKLTAFLKYFLKILQQCCFWLQQSDTVTALVLAWSGTHPFIYMQICLTTEFIKQHQAERTSGRQ